MLYPIELLGQIAIVKQNAQRRTACMLTASINFVMSSVGFLIVGQSCKRTRDVTQYIRALYTIVQIAFQQTTTIANCNALQP
ncbi:hypothetical protein [Pseudomonas orientalis]|nr:hypothetical protein [Pseudomonas orientalis]